MHVISLYLVLHTYAATFDVMCVKKKQRQPNMPKRPAAHHASRKVKQPTIQGQAAHYTRSSSKPTS
jgi:hypothetical protein